MKFRIEGAIFFLLLNLSIKCELYSDTESVGTTPSVQSSAPAAGGDAHETVEALRSLESQFYSMRTQQPDSKNLEKKYNEIIQQMEKEIEKAVRSFIANNKPPSDEFASEVARVMVGLMSRSQSEIADGDGTRANALFPFSNSQKIRVTHLMTTFQALVRYSLRSTSDGNPSTTSEKNKNQMLASWEIVALNIPIYYSHAHKNDQDAKIFLQTLNLANRSFFRRPAIETPPFKYFELNSDHGDKIQIPDNLVEALSKSAGLPVREFQQSLIVAEGGPLDSALNTITRGKGVWIKYRDHARTLRFYPFGTNIDTGTPFQYGRVRRQLFSFAETNTTGVSRKRVPAEHLYTEAGECGPLFRMIETQNAPARPRGPIPLSTVKGAGGLFITGG